MTMIIFQIVMKDTVLITIIILKDNHSMIITHIANHLMMGY